MSTYRPLTYLLLQVDGNGTIYPMSASRSCCAGLSNTKHYRARLGHWQFPLRESQRRYRGAQSAQGRSILLIVPGSTSENVDDHSVSAGVRGTLRGLAVCDTETCKAACEGCEAGIAGGGCTSESRYTTAMNLECLSTAASFVGAICVIESSGKALHISIRYLSSAHCRVAHGFILLPNSSPPQYDFSS